MAHDKAWQALVFYFPRLDPESDEYFDELFNIFLMRERSIRYVYCVVA